MPVLQLICEFARQFDGELVDLGEIDELQYLRNTCDVRDTELTDQQEKFLNDRAVLISEWLVSGLSADPDFSPHVCELAFLVIWLKVAALAGLVEERVYAVAKQNIAVLFKSYDEFLSSR